MAYSSATELILEAKEKKNLTFSQIADAAGCSEVFCTAAIYGQQTLSPDQAKAVTELLELPAEVERDLKSIPFRGANFSLPPTDPTIYRLYELVLVYGDTIKALIHEKFGDGIMSAIDFKMDLDKEEDPHGDRVVITLSGKFLKYKTF
ncbi:cyanase [Sporolactobacillus laevolacticus]|uniref:Cyanate hydratase n=1 Tax=Sporolactobacillus laevolacticus DSM 442 TaxID=1395513 RepID=V6J286_9BACL|nr:cyanase [Sporolactobacillus laevolacticus]EST10869.1 cyanate hydratase [Sporolactobacillus laevolacticus DSM 442]